MSKRQLAARHMHTARAAMFAVTSLHRPIKCPFLMPRTSIRTDWKRLNISRIYISVIANGGAHVVFYNPRTVATNLDMKYY